MQSAGKETGVLRGPKLVKEVGVGTVGIPVGLVVVPSSDILARAMG